MVIHPGVSVSTAEIFQSPELTRNSSPLTIRAFFEPGQTRNECEPVVRVRYPEVAAALDWLDAQSGVRDAHQGARLTGTGACVFASFEREQHARP